MSLKAEFDLLLDWIPQGARVLDLGCGNAELLAYLMKHKQVKGVGLEMDPLSIVSSISNGVDVIQADLNTANLIEMFGENAFDVVLTTQTLQSMQRPDHLIDSMLRIGKRAIVTFPNFGYWRNRLQLLLSGKMPVSVALPYQWYDTPNTHLCTFSDFEAFCQQKNIVILAQRVLGAPLGAEFSPNLFGEVALYHIEQGIR
ncbi:MAG: methionine biosynthesis protein MetW [Thiotrichales bacterium]|jgi:methionine biosynthesis protein MetW|nr:methionine biosynthesis protein MetW [Thiotrichales bacterium]